MTPLELNRAVQGYQEAQGIDEGAAPLTMTELEDLMEQFPDDPA